MATKTFKIGLSNTDKQNMAQDVYERVLDLTFAEYDSTKTYNTGDFVVYNDALYKCKEDSVTGTWDSSKWQSATLQDLLDDVEGAVASVSGKANTIDLQNGTLVPAKSLVAEQIENVSEDSGTVQDKPFTFQATATDGGTGASDTAPTAKYLKLKGKTYAFNQLQNKGNFATSTGWTADNGTISVSNNIATATWGGTNGNFRIRANQNSTKYQVLKNHTYLFKGKIKCNKALSNVYVSMSLADKDFGQKITSLSANTWFDFAVIYTMPNTITEQLQSPSIGLGTGITNQNPSTFLESGDTISLSEYQTIDLTQLFNGDIPDAILNGVELEDYSLTFTGIDIFNQLFPLPYYAYNAGSLVSANATKLSTIKYNQFDEELEVGYLNDTTGQPETNNANVRPKNYIKVIPSQLYELYVEDTTNRNRIIYEYDANYNLVKRTAIYYPTIKLKLTSNTHYVKFIYPNPDVSLKVAYYIYWDGTRTGYEEYVKHEYALGSELEEHPLLSAGSVCDEKLPDGTITRRIGVVDLGSLTWYAGSNNKFSCYVSGITNFKTPSANNVKANILCAKYITYTADDFSVNLQDKSISCPNGSGAMITIRDTNSAYTDAATFKAAMSGVYLYYELTTPTEEQGESFPEVIEVDDFGTMEYGGTNYNGYPQGCEFFYPADYVLFIDTLGNSVEWEAGNIATKNDLKYHELDSANIGEITTTTITTGFYKNSIAITSGLSTAIDVRVQMSNGAIYPAINNGGTELVIFNGTNFQTAGTTVVKVYWKN